MSYVKNDLWKKYHLQIKPPISTSDHMRMVACHDLVANYLEVHTDVHNEDLLYDDDDTVYFHVLELARAELLKLYKLTAGKSKQGRLPMMPLDDWVLMHKS